MFRRRSTVENRTVLVNLLSGNAVSGVCVRDGRDALVLRGATVHTADAEPAPADGEIVIDRINVDFLQLL